MTEFRKLTESSNVHVLMPELTLNSIEKLLEEERRLLAECETELSTSVDEAEKLRLALETITGVSSECDVVTDEDCISWKQYADAVADVKVPQDTVERVRGIIRRRLRVLRDASARREERASHLRTLMELQSAAERVRDQVVAGDDSVSTKGRVISTRTIHDGSSLAAFPP